MADAGDRAARAGSASARSSGSPKRSESSTAIGRAPTAKTSRRIPPTPVAAPWKGSTALGWLCDSTLNAHTQSVADVDRAGVLARAHDERRALGGQRAQELLGVLVRAVLGPQQREAAPARPAWAVARGARRSGRTRTRSGRARARARRARSRRSRSSGTGERRDRRLGSLGTRGQRGRIAANRVRPSAEPVSTSTACSGWGMRPNTLPASLHTPAMSPSEPFGFCRARSAGRSGPGSIAASSARRVVAPGGVLDRDRQALGPRDSRAVNGVRGLTTSRSTCRQTKRRPSLGSSAPGSRPASQQTWKPLQMPNTRPPSRANSATASITGAKRATAPGAQVVAVGEAARHDHGVDAAQVALGVPQQHRLSDPRRGELGIDLVAGAGEADDAEPHRGESPIGSASGAPSSPSTS